MYATTIGSISHGTLRNIDLLEAFADELDRIETDRNDVAEARAILTLHNAGWSGIADHEYSCELVDALTDALNEYAPAYCYFGTTEGDGSDYGFWPSMESVEELPRVNDSDEAKALGEDCIYVNDHGNVTLFGGDGAVIWEIV